MKSILKKNKGITLIALVITIIVLLILAGVSIAMLTGDNGILTRASDAKIETAVGAVKEQLKLYQIEKKMQGEKVTPETLLGEGKVSRKIEEKEKDIYYMYYALKDNAFDAMQGLGKGDFIKLKDIFLIDDDFNVRYIDSKGREYGDKIKEKILKDDTEIRFSSKKFSKYISEKLGVKEEELNFKWMKNQTSLKILDPEVDSLQDLVFFPNLTYLQLGSDYGGRDAPNITSMDGIENCTKLKEIIIIQGPDKEYKAITNLINLVNFRKIGGSDYRNIIDHLSLCQSLKGLEIQYQKIKDMKIFSKLYNLERLQLQNNSIAKIEGLENMKNLKILYLSSNEIKKIEGLNNLSKLVTLALDNNLITQIEGLDKLINLSTLWLTSNKISDITPLSKNTSLKNLDLRRNPDIDENRKNYTGERLEALNKIGEILDRGGEINLNVSKLKLFNNYTMLRLQEQNMTTLEPLEGLKNLRYLYLSGNKLTLEDNKSQEILKDMTNLEVLELNNNLISDITAINELKKLRELNLVGNIVNLAGIEDIISNLVNLRVNQTTFNTITKCNLSKIKSLRLSHSVITELPDLSKFNELKTLELYGCTGIKNFDIISKFESLNRLVLSSTKLHGRMINFSSLSNLTYLELNLNGLWSEDLEKLKGLKNNKNLKIYLNQNNIIDATGLLELDASIYIDLSRNINLSQDSKEKLKAKFGGKVTF